MTEWLSAGLIRVLNLSLPTGFAVVLVFLARLALRRAPKLYSYLLWIPVLLRMVLPFSFESAVSPIPVGSTAVPAEIGYAVQPAIESGFAPLDTAVNAVLPAAAPAASINPMQVLLAVGAWLWLMGLTVMIVWSLLSLAGLRRRLRGARAVDGHVYESGGIDTAFVLGLFRPRIYLPEGIGEEARSYILLHERAHIRRGDHIVKLVFFAASCVHWFNPLVWVAFRLLCRDMEMSCDESVLRRMDGDKKAYAETLLSLVSARSLPSGAPLAFGENDVKGRIKNVLKFKKPALWVTLVCVAVAAVIGLAALLSPKAETDAFAPEKGTQNGAAEAAGWENPGDPGESRVYLSATGENQDGALLADALCYAMPPSGETLFCVVDAASVYSEDRGDQREVVGWVRCGEYALSEDGGTLVEMGAAMLPLAAKYKFSDTGEFEVTGVMTAKDGSLYEGSVRAMCVGLDGSPIDNLAEHVMNYDTSALETAYAAHAEQFLREVCGALTRAGNGRDFVLDAPFVPDETHGASAGAADRLTMPTVEGMALGDAVDLLEKSHVEAVVIGGGDTVVTQMPKGGAALPGGGANASVYFYTDDRQPEMMVVPEVTGSEDIARAIGVLRASKLNWQIAGAAGENAAVVRQEPVAGTEMPKGAVVTLYFKQAVYTGPDSPAAAMSFVAPIAFDSTDGAHISRGVNEYHTGIDIAAPHDTPIYAAADGTVIEVVEDAAGYGYYIVVNHGAGITTLYAHNSRNLVRVGDRVSAGERIASVGSTGNSTGNHLHFELLDETFGSLDPLQYVSGLPQ